ncbi:hypothetical protein [Streptomyces flavidovirens]|uniref:hypothetical protein n=1 Tax=Streptomyces flavidovirens TaxID=67298 RepID=UPI0012FED7D1|nr:hypothetical protein [Streptomyces flavidovirens]
MAGPVHLMPVDYVSAATLHISRKEEAAGRTFHLYNPDEPTFAEAAEPLRSFGYPRVELRCDAWLERVTSDRDNAMVPLLDAFEMLTANSDGFYPPRTFPTPARPWRAPRSSARSSTRVTAPSSTSCTATTPSPTSRAVR